MLYGLTRVVRCVARNVVKLSLVTSVVLTSVAVAQDASTAAKKDALPVIKENLAGKKAILLDVRELQEWNDGHLAAAKLLPLSKLKSGESPKDVAGDPAKGTIVYCHCKAGRRAVEAATLLRKMGYDARPVAEGYDALLKNGFEKAK